MPRKVFVAGEILTAADVNTNLMDQAVMVFDDSAARGSAIPTPSEGMVTYLKDTNQVQAFNGSAFAPLGTILQVVSTTLTTALSVSLTAGNFSSNLTGLDVTITPSSTSSKIFVSFSTSVVRDDNRALGGFRIVRGATAVGVGTSVGSRGPVTSGTGNDTAGSVNIAPVSGQFLDSPATTSAVTYGLQLYGQATATFFVNRTGGDSDSAGFTRPASTITVMEVAG